ncbi:NUMOD3 domain-containing DNA-binding protein [Clostridium perfringens]|uniref:NUMOD3 domain-containing DNA-binding protein n=1 Tax=Clostridium perfringens TaxID=1502 RepID=UPI0039EBDE5D
MDKKYYVYRHFIGENTFYVGSAQGNENRAYQKTSRPKKWYEIVNGNNGEYEVEILEYFSNRSEAKKREIEVIHYYHDLGQAEASKEDFRGKNNPMYGVNVTTRMTPEAIVEWKSNLSKANKGKNNPRYGKSPFENMTNEEIEKWKKNISERNKGTGNPRANYSEDDVRKIRDLYDSGLSIMDIIKIIYPELKTFKERKSKWTRIKDIAVRKTYTNVA